MKRRDFSGRLAALCMLPLLAGCSSLSLQEPPVVSLTNLRIIESQGLSMRFAIDLTITNPGSVAIPLNGIAWSLRLEGSQILTGVSNQVEALAPYTEQSLTLEAATNLTGMVELFTRLMNRPDDLFDYELHTRLGMRGLRLAYEHIDSGTINLSR